MPRIIFKCPYIKPGTAKAAAHLNNYVRYVATRDGVEKLTPDKAALPATKKQRAMVERLLRDFPMCRGMFEYEDYQSSPTRAAASEFITRAAHHLPAPGGRHPPWLRQRQAVAGPPLYLRPADRGRHEDPVGAVPLVRLLP